MGFFTALMTYLVTAALLVGGMVTGFAVFLAQPPEAGLAAKPRPPLVRSADRKAEPSKAMSPQSTAAPAPGPVINHAPADALRLNNEERAKQPTASQPARKKKVAKPAPAPPPREPDAATPDSATLGYGPPEPRKFIFPLDPGW